MPQSLDKDIVDITSSARPSDGCQTANLLLVNPAGLPVDGPGYLVSNADPTLDLDLDLVWSYGLRFCCEQLFRDQKSGIFQLASSGLREPERIDRLLLIVAIAVLVSSLQDFVKRRLAHVNRHDVRGRIGEGKHHRLIHAAASDKDGDVGLVAPIWPEDPMRVTRIKPLPVASQPASQAGRSTIGSG